MKIHNPKTDKAYRYEFKYRVPNYLRAALESEFLKMGFQDDPHLNGNGHYIVNSIYFDTFDLEDYLDKAGGFLSRKKIRVRIYRDRLTPETPEIWLEIKRKQNTRVFKERALLTREQWANFSNLRTSQDKVLNKALFYIMAEQRRPVVLVKYKRTPYLYSAGGFDVRFTFDCDLEACKVPDFGYNNSALKVLPNDFVLEVKFDKFLPAWFDFIVKKYDLKRDSFSKYGLAMETVRRFNPIPR